MSKVIAFADIEDFEDLKNPECLKDFAKSLVANGFIDVSTRNIKEDKKCPVCGSTIKGRSDKITCSAKCKKAWQRQRAKAKLYS